MKESSGASVALTDYNALIARDDIDAVSVATPDFTHTPIILAALKANKHVLSEKPLATTVREAEQIVEAAAASKGKLMIDFTTASTRFWRRSRPWSNPVRSVCPSTA